MIELLNIHKSLGGRKILNGINLRVEKGETLAIVGASGTGKSVTLKHMVGLLRPDEGQVLIDDQDLFACRGEALTHLRLKFGMLFQSGALINWQTVGDNVALPLIEHSTLSREEIQAKVTEKLHMVGLSGAENKFPSEISGGMKKRVALARAIIHDPMYILYDEPTSGLDPVMSRAVDDLTLQMQRDLGVTSVVVTHDMTSAFKVADKIAMLDKGVVIEIGSPHEFQHSQHPLVQEFIKAQFAADNLEEVP